MKITKLYLFVNLLVISANIIIFSGKSFASNSDADFVYIDGREYPKQEIIDDFINVAFSDFDWNDDADEDDRIALKKWLSSDEYFANNSKYPPPKWLQKHTGLKKDDLLDRNVLHKWEGKEITFGFGTPYSAGLSEAQNDDQEQLFRQSFEFEMARWRGAHIEKIAERIKVQISKVSPSIGKEINIIKPGDVWDNASTFGKIRLLFPSEIHPRSTVIIHHEYAPEAYEEQFLNGILFESFAVNNFDGYLLPQADYALDIVFCKIQNKLREQDLNARINECIVRAMGLPSMSQNPQSILSNWHSGEGIELRGGGSAETETTTIKRFSNIPAYDQYLLSILYCDDLKSGMNIRDVRRVLNDDNCLKNN